MSYVAKKYSKHKQMNTNKAEVYNMQEQIRKQNMKSLTRAQRLT